MRDIIIRIGSTLKLHFSEATLFCALFLMLAFATHMSAVHNDSLAVKGTEFAGQILSALVAFMVGASKTTPPPPSPPVV